MVVLAAGTELSLLRSCGGLEASTEPRALKCRCPGRAVATEDGDRRRAARGRLPARCLDLEQDDASPSFLNSVHAACAQVRQTMMLVTQRELQGVPWLLRCVTAEICALMCELCIGSVAVSSTVCVIVAARSLHMQTGPVDRRSIRPPACSGKILDLQKAYSSTRRRWRAFSGLKRGQGATREAYPRNRDYVCRMLWTHIH